MHIEIVRKSEITNSKMLLSSITDKRKVILDLVKEINDKKTKLQYSMLNNERRNEIKENLSNLHSQIIKVKK